MKLPDAGVSICIDLVQGIVIMKSVDNVALIYTKIGGPNKCGTTIFTSVSSMSQSTFYIQNFGEKNWAKVPTY